VSFKPTYKIGFLKDGSDTILEVSLKFNSIPQNQLIRWSLFFTYILWNYLISSRYEPLTLNI